VFHCVFHWAVWARPNNNPARSATVSTVAAILTFALVCARLHSRNVRSITCVRVSTIAVLRGAFQSVSRCAARCTFSRCDAASRRLDPIRFHTLQYLLTRFLRWWWSWCRCRHVVAHQACECCGVIRECAELARPPDRHRFFFTVQSSVRRQPLDRLPLQTKQLGVAVGRPFIASHRRWIRSGGQRRSPRPQKVDDGIFA
jgi:hypothetical protein